MGEYHFRGDEGWRMLLPRFLGSGNSYSCSGILTLAFLAFSNLAPSSVEPFSPQRTWKEGSGPVTCCSHTPAARTEPCLCFPSARIQAEEQCTGCEVCLQPKFWTCPSWWFMRNVRVGKVFRKTKTISL